jgi:putative transposase
LGVIPVFAHPYNARAKIIEGWFRWFGNSFERLLPAYTGASIEDSRLSHAERKKIHNDHALRICAAILEAIEYIELCLPSIETAMPAYKGKTNGEVLTKKGPGVELTELDDL